MLATQVESRLLLHAAGSLKVCVAAVVSTGLVDTEEFFYLLENSDVDEKVVMTQFFCLLQKLQHARQ